MISKQNLLRQVDVLLELKNRLTPLLNQHIVSAISFSGLKEGDQNMIRDMFKNVAAEQAKHITLLNEIKNSVEQKSVNAY